jgi:hypothetical protein
VSLRDASFPLLAGENAMMGGFEPNALKKENGVRLGIPSSDNDDTKAMGRGAIPPSIIL